MNNIHRIYFEMTEEEYRFMTKSTDTTKVSEYFEIFDRCVTITNDFLFRPNYIILKTEILRFINTYLGRHILEIDTIFRKSLLKDIKHYKRDIPYDCHNDINVFKFICEIDYIYNILLDIRDYKYYKKYYGE